MLRFVLSLALAACLLQPGGAHAQAVETIVVEGRVKAPPAEVWAAWTTAGGLQSWLAPHATIDLRIDGLMRVNGDPDGVLGDAGTIENRILAFEPERMLSIRVSKAPEQFPFKAAVGAMWTVLSLHPTEEGDTLLRIVGLGFGPDPESQQMKAFFERGNAFTLGQLQKRFQP